VVYEYKICGLLFDECKKKTWIDIFLYVIWYFIISMVWWWSWCR
jgi:hypothetical protein